MNTPQREIVKYCYFGTDEKLCSFEGRTKTSTVWVKYRRPSGTTRFACADCFERHKYRFKGNATKGED